MRNLNGSLDSTWSQFKATGSIEARNLLVEHYWPVVCYHARKLKLNGGTFAFEDLTQGFFPEFVRLLNRYDPARNVKFDTFLYRFAPVAMMREVHRWSFGPLNPNRTTPPVESLKLSCDLSDDEAKEWEEEVEGGYTQHAR